MKKSIIILASAFVAGLLLAFVGSAIISEACRIDYQRAMDDHGKRVYLGQSGGYRWFMSDSTQDAYVIQEKIVE